MAQSAMNRYRAKVKESEELLFQKFQETLRNPLASEPEKKCAYILWGVKAHTPDGSNYLFKSIARIAKATKTLNHKNNYETLSIDPDDGGERVFRKGLCEQSPREWIADYKQYGLEGILRVRRVGRRTRKPRHSYSSVELNAAIASYEGVDTKECARMASYLQSLLMAKQRQFMVTGTEVEQLGRMGKMPAKMTRYEAIDLLRLASEYSQDGKSFKELIEGLKEMASINHEPRNGKNLDADHVAYQFKAGETLGAMIRDAKTSMDRSMAAFFRTSINSFFDSSPSNESIEKVRRWLELHRQEKIDFTATVRVDPDCAKKLEDIRNERTDGVLMQEVIGWWLLQHG